MYGIVPGDGPDVQVCECFCAGGSPLVVGFAGGLGGLEGLRDVLDGGFTVGVGELVGCEVGGLDADADAFGTVHPCAWE